MKRKNAIASDSEADSDTEVPKGTPITPFIYLYFHLSVFNCSHIPNPRHFPKTARPTGKDVAMFSVHREVVQI